MDIRSLTLVTRLSVAVGEPIVIGAVHEGTRRVVPILGGTVRGPRLNGEVLPSGADYQIVRPDGYTTLEARYVIRLGDGVLVYVVNKGILSGAPDVMARIFRGEAVDPALVYFRTVPRFETAAVEDQWLTRPLFIGTGARHPDRVELAFFEVG